MNKIISELKNKLQEFENKEIYIEIRDAIQYQTTIKNGKIILSNEKLIISNQEEKDFIMELHYLDELQIEESIIKLIMYNDLTIIISY